MAVTHLVIHTLILNHQSVFLQAQLVHRDQHLGQMTIQLIPRFALPPYKKAKEADKEMDGATQTQLCCKTNYAKENVCN